MKIIVTSILLLGAASAIFAVNTFPLTDTHPNSSEYKKRFLGSYGINPAIEPSIAQDDRPLYESIAPFLESNPVEAIRVASQGITADSNAAFDFLVGSLYYSQQQYPQAERYLKQALRKFPDFRRAHRNLALIYVQQNKFELSNKHLLTVIALGGGDDQSYGMLAYGYLNQDKYQSALSAYAMARIFAPDSTDLRRGQAQCLLMTDQYEAAIALFDELIAEDPSVTDYWLFQANAYLAKERLDDALSNLEIASSLGNGSFDTYKLLADLYLTKDIPELAVKNYTQAITRNPQVQADLAFKPLYILIQRNLLPEAKSYFNTIKTVLKTELSPDQAIEIAVMSAQIKMQDEQAEAAIATLENILETNPVNANTLLTLADFHLQLEAYEDAEFYFERASHINEVAAKALVGLGRVKVQTGDLEGALKHLEDAHRIDPRNDVKRFISSIANTLTAHR